MVRSMELYLVASLITASIVTALWLLAKRIRTWKEQILHSVSVVESNNAIAHEVTRNELSQQVDRLGVDKASIEPAQEVVEPFRDVRDELQALRCEIDDLSTQASLRR